MKKSSSKATASDEFCRDVDWELRPGGMIVQKRHVGPDHSSADHMIRVKVSHGSCHHQLTLHAQSTFGDLKRALWEETGLEPRDQRLLFRGKEKENEECLHMAGVNDMSKVVLLEDPAARERKMKKNRTAASEAIAEIRTEVDRLSDKVMDLERCGGNGGGGVVEVKEITAVTELLMVQLLKLDAIETDGDAKLHRRNEVLRVQNFVDRLDNLKARIPIPFNPRNDVVPVTTRWEAFGSTKITHDWELFD